MKGVKLTKGLARDLTWLPGFAGLGVWEIATDKTSQDLRTVLSGRYLPHTAGPPEAAAKSRRVPAPFMFFIVFMSFMSSAAIPTPPECPPERPPDPSP